MGQEGSVPNQPKDPNNKNPGYTSFSVSKQTVNEQNAPTKEKQNTPTKKQNIEKKVDDIVVVVKKEEIQEKDEILDALYRIPQITPLIKGEETSILNFFKVKEEKSKLEKIDEQMLLDIVAQFQTNMIQQTQKVSNREILLYKKFHTCRQQSMNTLQDVQDKHVELQNVSHSLRETDKMNRFIEQSARNIEQIMKQIDELHELLPKDVLDKIDNPLTKK